MLPAREPGNNFDRRSRASLSRGTHLTVKQKLPQVHDAGYFELEATPACTLAGDEIACCSRKPQHNLPDVGALTGRCAAQSEAFFPRWGNFPRKVHPDAFKSLQRRATSPGDLARAGFAGESPDDAHPHKPRSSQCITANTVRTV
jgi:hypothetical protein